MQNQQKQLKDNQKIKRRGTVKIQQSDGPPQQLYHPSYSILTIGDGDLSFSCSISQWFVFRYKQNAQKMIATTYDSQETLIKMYHLAVKNNIDKLKKNQAKVYHEIDVNKMPEYANILDQNKQKFERIVWNFPHAGFPEQQKGPGFQWEEDFHKKHTELLQKFFEYSNFYIKQNGKVLMAHKTVQPFSIWNIPGIANKHGFKLQKSFPFKMEDYPGYQNRRGAGKNSGKRFPMQDAVQYVFIR